MEIFELITKALLEHGAIGLLAAAGWSLSGWQLWRDNTKVQERDIEVKAKEEIIQNKDKEIASLNEKLVNMTRDLQEKRIEDFKALNEDYNEALTNNVQVLDKLVMALDVKNSITGG